jgi:hypothetical protein
MKFVQVGVSETTCRLLKIGEPGCPDRNLESYDEYNIFMAMP